jgi:methionine-rich copper-binding protein CopC|tara:strand:- start:5792 stop:6331 length:540 start_codon:yes stop_codon:yes gene_type:complete
MSFYPANCHNLPLEECDTVEFNRFYERGIDMKMSALLRLIAIIGASTAIQATAFAHTALSESTPGDGAMVKEPPANINLVFTEPVQLVKFEVMGTGHEMPTEFKLSTEAHASFTIVTPGMHAGNFTVNWAAIGADGHTVTNSYAFVVDPTITEDHAEHEAEGGHDDHAAHHGDGGANPH